MHSGVEVCKGKLESTAQPYTQQSRGFGSVSLPLCACFTTQCIHPRTTHGSQHDACFTSHCMLHCKMHASLHNESFATAPCATSCPCIRNHRGQPLRGCRALVSLRPFLATHNSGPVKGRRREPLLGIMLHEERHTTHRILVSDRCKARRAANLQRWRPNTRQRHSMKVLH